MSTSVLKAEEIDAAQAIQHADDLERDRAFRRSPAAPAAFCRIRSVACFRSSGRSSATRSPRRPAQAIAEPGEPKPDLLGDYLRYVAKAPGPKIAVGWDRDEPAGPGRAVR